jgi:hypothetical protein
MYQSLKYRPPKTTCFWQQHLYSSLMCFFSAPWCEITSVQWVGKHHSTMLGDHVGALSLHFRLLWANCFTHQVSASLDLSLVTAAVRRCHTKQKTANFLYPFKQSCQHCMALSDRGNNHVTDCPCFTLQRHLGFITLDNVFIQNPDHYLLVKDATLFLLQYSWLYTFVGAGHDQNLTDMRQLRTIILTTPSARLSTVQW